MWHDAAGDRRVQSPESGLETDSFKEQQNQPFSQGRNSYSTDISVESAIFLVGVRLAMEAESNRTLGEVDQADRTMPGPGAALVMAVGRACTEAG